MGDALVLDPNALASICRKHHIRRLSLFGSTLAGTARPDSDVDLLVEFEPRGKPGLIGMARSGPPPDLHGRSPRTRTRHD